jgi:hypothetical protein
VGGRKRDVWIAEWIERWKVVNSWLDSLMGENVKVKVKVKVKAKVKLSLCCFLTKHHAMKA